MQTATRRVLHYVGAAVHEGQPIKGVELAPAAVREAGLFKALDQYDWDVVDHGDVSQETVRKELVKEENKSRINNNHLLDALLFEVYEKVKTAALQAKKDNGFVLTVGGDHSVAAGSIPALKEVYPDLKVIWIDAHGDIIIPSLSPYPNYHGMPASHVLGLIPKEDIKGFDWLKTFLNLNEISYFGLRDVDVDEKRTLKERGIQCFTPENMLLHGGIGPSLERALKYLDPEEKGVPIHVSLDIDGCDPSIAPGTGTKARGGLTYREIMYIMRRLYKRGNFVSLDLVEINPRLDPPEKLPKIFGDCQELDATATVFLGCDIVLSACGRSNFHLDV